MIRMRVCHPPNRRALLYAARVDETTSDVAAHGQYEHCQEREALANTNRVRQAGRQAVKELSISG